MTPSRASQLEQGLNGMARKIYEVMPVKEAWGFGQILAELKRINGTAPDMRVLQGTISHLLAIGLAREEVSGGYSRIAPRASVRRLAPVSSPQPGPSDPDPPATTDQPAPNDRTTPASKPTSNTRDAITAIAEVSAKVRNVIILLSRLAEELDDVAVEIEEHHQATSRDADQLRKLRDLLRAV